MPLLRQNIENYQYLYERPSAQAYGIGQCQVAGVEYISDGKTWYGGTPVTLYNSYLGIIFPSLQTGNGGSYSQSGTTITVTSTAHLIPATVHNGKKVYFDPGVAATGATITQRLFDNFTYVDANTFTCTASNSQTGTGSGVVTQTSAITVPDFSVTVPANLLGLNGYIDVYNMSLCNASAGTKRISFSLSTLSFKNPSPASTTVAVQENHRIQNQNSLAKQIAIGVGTVGNVGNSTVAPVLGTVNTAVDQSITATVTLNTASEFITLEHVVITAVQG